MTGPSKVIPDLDTLPDIEEIGQIATWLAEAGVESVELSSCVGGRLRISVAPVSLPVGQGVIAQPVPQPAAVELVAAKAPFFGRLCLVRPPGEDAFAPVGSTVHKGDIVALLTLETLQVPVTAPVDGEIVEIVGRAGDLVGYGAEILKIRPGGV
ncbi:acetyl-CoA carboxylase biotin carboxyl carrier protein [Gluconacetobacter tumulisoli]|uniref:acetyl-CoA carboxylase biotin carboxyl carrier protein n=1 Tax=Gluconacetobacter tumulisoli TaxID=1286189 RepID=UPI0030840A70